VGLAMRAKCWIENGDSTVVIDKAFGVLYHLEFLHTAIPDVLFYTCF
jgi:hypothetical protein